MAGNWKMNLDHLEAAALVQRLYWELQDANFDYSKVEVVVLPPFTDLRSTQTVTDADSMHIKYGAQDVSTHPDGAYTGEISARMLAKLGCSYVVVGHSERRQYHGETDQEVGQKALAAFGGEMVPIICVGEPLPVRKSGEHVAYTLAQLDGVFAELSGELARDAVVAYEPVWAIGTGEVATADDAEEVCAAIRVRLGELFGGDVSQRVRVLYGGSVKASNVAGIMAQPNVDGALVGGASLDAAEFARICRFHDHVA
jgi:triosephosphate isomerase